MNLEEFSCRVFEYLGTDNRPEFLHIEGIPDHYSMPFTRTVHSYDSNFAVLYRNLSMPSDSFFYEASFEYEALREHLTKMERSEFREVNFRLEGAKAAITMPWLGYGVERMVKDWHARGAPEQERPVTVSEFSTLVRALYESEHVNGHAGIWNMVKHPEKGPCFVDIVSNMGIYENREVMKNRLVDCARSLIIPYNELPVQIAQELGLNEY